MNIWIFFALFVFFLLLSVYVPGGVSLSIAICSLSLGIFLAYTTFGVPGVIIVVVVTIAASTYASLKALAYAKKKENSSRSETGKK